MRSGVMRASVRSRFRWRMISWPAARPMRCVKPSIATVSPSRTSSATASRMEATFDAVNAPPKQACREPAGGGGTSARGPGRTPLPSPCGFRFVERAGGLGFVRHALRLRGDLGDRLLEQPQSRCHLRLRHDKRGRHPDGRYARLEDEQTALEAGPLNGLRELRGREVDPDHEPLATDLTDKPAEPFDQRPQPRQRLAAAKLR